jgi:hypothetical protein
MRLLRKSLLLHNLCIKRYQDVQSNHHRQRTEHQYSLPNNTLMRPQLASLRTCIALNAPSLTWPREGYPDDLIIFVLLNKDAMIVLARICESIPSNKSRTSHSNRQGIKMPQRPILPAFVSPGTFLLSFVNHENIQSLSVAPSPLDACWLQYRTKCVRYCCHAPK